jgi:peptidoglycan/xylan/chitin deacetylase (PgdA/CDA1 family)
MYHRVIESHSQNPLRNSYGYSILLQQFEDEMAYLAEHCNVILASEGINGDNISLNKKNVVLTFDDGHRTNYTNVFPILLRYNLPALFSIPTGFVINRVPLWFDYVEYGVIKTKRNNVHIPWQKKDHSFSLQTTSDKLVFFSWFHTKCGQIIPEYREAFIKNVLNELEVPAESELIFSDPDYSPITLDDIKEMSNSQIAEFASHSKNHYDLSRISKNTLLDELLGSKLEIEKATGKPCKFICLPSGLYNESVINMISNSKYEKVFSSDVKEYNPECPSFVIGRYTINNATTISIFADIVHGPLHRIFFSLKGNIDKRE